MSREIEQMVEDFERRMRDQGWRRRLQDMPDLSGLTQNPSKKTEEQETIRVVLCWPNEKTFGVPKVVKTMDEAMIVAREWVQDDKRIASANLTEVYVIETKYKITRVDPC